MATIPGSPTAKRHSPLIVDERATLIFSGFPSFLGAPWVECDTESLRQQGAKVAFLGMPFDQATAYRSGESHGPKGLRNISEQFLPYLGEFDINIFDEFNLVDAGDVPIIPANAERSRGLIKEYVGRVLDAGALPLLCGGDHSCPIPVAEALSEHIEGTFGYLHIDAHIDACLELQGERYTNWSTVSRIAENPSVDPDNIALVGIRGALNPPEQFDFLKEHGIHLFTMRSVIQRGIEDVMTDALQRVRDGTAGFYVSWDLDSIDCSSTPGTNGPEPGGLVAREAMRAAEMIGAAEPNIFDVSEYLPAYDQGGITGRLACYLYFNVLGGLATSGKPLER